MAPVPPGIRFLTSFNRDQWYRAFTFGLTFLLYTSFHLSRKPISIVKSELHKNCSHVMEAPTESSSSQQPVLHPELDCSWKPFDRNNYKQLLGAMDYSFLCAYAIGMYLSGIIGERLPIRLYLTVGMLTSGLFTCLFGLGYIYDIHSLGFYIFVQVANGLVQTTGWPSVVTCIGNWFGKGRRGLIMGLWNSHTSVGNILGSLIAGYYVSSNWGLSFIVPGVIIAAMGVICFLFLIERLPVHRAQNKLILDVLRMSTFFSNFSFLVNYFFNIARCLRCISCFSAHLDAKKAGDLSTLFDVGGIVGGILAGVLSDKLGKRATTCAVMLLLAAPTLYGFSMMSQFGLGPTIGMLLVCGGLVNGPYALITTAVSADLGTHKSLKGNARALSTVTAIIDGTGSVGAAVGPLLAGLLSARGWDQVFYMLMTADFLALLVRIWDPLGGLNTLLKDF
uniref:Glycerol-3-phosphate transporter-like n=1 Tax=Sinocyclocheilus anshuiensis TaxID=1608454 RepID=A0A671MAD6_9TELE